MTLTESDNDTQKTFILHKHVYSNKDMSNPDDQKTNKLIKKSIEKGR